MRDKITLSVIKADVGGWIGHSRMHPALEERAREELAVDRKSTRLNSSHSRASRMPSSA